MKFARTFYGYGFLMLLAAAGTACRSDSFASGDAHKKDAGETQKDSGNGDPSACDFSSEQVKIAFPGNIQACVDSGRIFDFDGNKCTNMPANKSCTFSDIMDKAQNLHFKVDEIQDSLVSTANQMPLDVQVTTDNLRERAKIVSCGTSPDTRTLVAQWYFPPTLQKDAASCQFKPEMNIMTVCYRKYLQTESKPPTPQTQDDQKRAVSLCLQRL